MPPYDVLDPVLELLIEHDLSVEDVVGRGFDHGVATKVARLLLASEYKRRQAPPGVRITERAATYVAGIITTPEGPLDFRYDSATQIVHLPTENVAINEYGWEIEN